MRSSLVCLAVAALASAAAAQPYPGAGRTLPPVPGANQQPVTLTLPDAVLIGLRKNRTIRSEYLQRIADKFALYVAEQTFTPTASLTAAVTRARQTGLTSNVYSLGPNITWTLPTGATVTGGVTNVQTNARGQAGSGLSQVTFQVVQPLLQGAGYDIASAPIRIGRLNEKSNKLRLQQTVIDNVTQIILAYRAVIQAGEQQKIANEALKRARDLLEVNRILIAAGRLAAVELVQSEASIAQQQLALSTSQNQFDASKLALVTLLALDPGTQIKTVDTLTAVPVRVDEATALKIAYDRQPAYLTQLISIELSRISLEVARNQRLWNLSAVAGGGQQASAGSILNTFTDLPSRRPDYSVGLTLSIPLHNPTLEQGEVNATIALRQADLGLEQLRDQVGQQVRDGVRNIAIAGGQLETARRSRELAQQQLDIELTKLQVGRSSNFQVVSFQNSLQQAQTTELAAVITYLNALTSLDQLLGTTLDTWRISLEDQ